MATEYSDDENTGCEVVDPLVADIEEAEARRTWPGTVYTTVPMDNEESPQWP